MRVKKDKCYLVVSKRNGYIQGAFPRTEEGKIQAEAYLNKINKDEEYVIKEGWFFLQYYLLFNDDNPRGRESHS